MDIDELVDDLTGMVRQAVDPPMGLEDALEVLEGLVSNLETSINGLKHDIREKKT